MLLDQAHGVIGLAAKASGPHTHEVALLGFALLLLRSHTQISTCGAHCACQAV